MMQSYSDFIDKHFSKKDAFLIKVLSENGYVDELQIVLNNMGNTLLVDGILGFKTLTALSRADTETVYIKLSELVSDEPRHGIIKESEIRNFIMTFLSRWESTKVHYNKNEKSYTTPYGVYRYANKNSEIIKYVDSLFLKYGLSYKIKRHSRVLNSKLTGDEKLRIRDLAWEHYKKHYLNHKVMAIFIEQGKKKCIRSWASNSINGGVSRGYKSLITALGLPVPNNRVLTSKQKASLISRLPSIAAHKTDDTLNKGIVNYMIIYHKFLATMDKYKGNLRGWMNRDNSLL